MAGTRVRRSKEERIAEIDKKIETHKSNIAVLEAKKASILKPSQRKKKLSIKNIVNIAKDSGLSEKEIAEKLGISLE